MCSHLIFIFSRVQGAPRYLTVVLFFTDLLKALREVTGNIIVTQIFITTNTHCSRIL